MTITTNIPRRLAVALLTTAPFVLLGPVAQAAQPLNPGYPAAPVHSGTGAVSCPVATGWSTAGARPLTLASALATDGISWVSSSVATGWSTAVTAQRTSPTTARATP
jgi:hypothetical protein